MNFLQPRAMVLKRLSTAQKEEEENKIDDLIKEIAPEKPRGFCVNNSR